MITGPKPTLDAHHVYLFCMVIMQRQMERWIDALDVIEVLCGRHVLIWIWSTGQHVRMTIHGRSLST